MLFTINLNEYDILNLNFIEFNLNVNIMLVIRLKLILKYSFNRLNNNLMFKLNNIYNYVNRKQIKKRINNIQQGSWW